jgi:DNA polymerase III psi subunit
MNFRLPSGELKIELPQTAETQFERLLAIGQRQNPKRGFLLVSKVLGKHLAVSPAVMLKTYFELASQLEKNSEITTWIGMAETATALGQGVFEAYHHNHDNHQSLYLHTTRYPLEHPSLTFDETHSHAPNHYLHLAREHQTHFAKTTRLMLIDDEISTGQTLLRLARAFNAIAPNLKEITLISLTDFLGLERQTLLSQFPVRTQSISLLKAGLSFTPNLDWVAQLPVNPQFLTHVAPASPHRLGTRALGFEREQLKHLANNIARELQTKNNTSRVQVIGTGEYQFEPFLLALSLCNLGLDVVFRASTRSPILNFGIIQDRVLCTDPYGQQVENYLYNNAEFTNLPIIACAETNQTNYLPFTKDVTYLNLYAGAV